MAQPDLRPGDGPVALILAPTRELAKQCQEVAEVFGTPCGVHTVAVYGGADKERDATPLCGQYITRYMIIHVKQF